MNVPVEITFRNMSASEALEAKIRDKVKKLEQFCDRITSCKVIVESNHRQQHKGHLFHVGIELTLPGQDLVVSRDPADKPAHADAYVALRDAFDAARRQLDKHVRSNRREAKAHGNQPAPRGRVHELNPMLDFGRILTSDGRDIYFHRNSLVNGDFEKLEVGNMVRFSEETGDEGPQASSVYVLS
jgi:ribosomal subunit interface protein